MILHVPPRHEKGAHDRQLPYVLFDESFAVEMFNTGQFPRAHFRDVREG